MRLALVVLLSCSSVAFAYDDPEGALREQSADLAHEVEQRCGSKFTVTADWSTFVAKAWDNDKSEAVTSCMAAAGAMSNLCLSDWKAPAARVVKGVRCVFSGSSPRKGDDEDFDVFIRRNMSFADGVLTVREAAGMMNVEQNAQRVIARALQKEADSPVKGGMHGAAAGESCDSAADCDSVLCVKNVCTVCGSKATCGAGTQCYGNRCMTPSEVAGSKRATTMGDTSPSSNAPKGHLKRLGQSCKEGSECASGKCAQRTANLRTCQ